MAYRNPSSDKGRGSHGCVSSGASSEAKCKETGEFQKVSFRSKKRKQTFYPRADSLKANGFYTRLLGDMNMKMAEPFPASRQGIGNISERDTDAEVKDS